jgi:hypothetical protein
VAELGVALSVAGVIVGFFRMDVALITAAVILGLASGARGRRVE